eukprot:CAMPEP_0178919868 /NCGR_PEP_ID=MMETSP0786-20121207/14680_1 /TAXON_ID=186022 /ORGANISM="Thalassionema frauenfeldii, Strain CCMP 1798" /LENGTH=442 /DNA_ID=CAMNT_0020593855 /DNA_START=192 /DNA_END=1520 /DNA_ORIENTATION=-
MEQNTEYQRKNFRKLSKHRFVKYAALVAFFFVIDKQFFSFQGLRRQLSISLPQGDCIWTEGRQLPLDSNPYGTLLASYPSGGMRDLWKQVEGLTGIKVGDAYWFGGEQVGIIKTQYPHYEGIWSYGATLDQVILLVRNPRWNIPAFHHYLHEVNYGQTFEEVYEHMYDIFSERSPLEEWIKWRDLNFENELNLWAYFIDFYMEGGSQYWEDLDVNRVGHKPLYFRNETERPWPMDERCTDCMNCVPAKVISYEKLKDNSTGPEELRKIAEALRDKEGMTVISDDSIECIWQDTWTHNTAPSNNDRGGLPEADFGFTNLQLEEIYNTLNEMKSKYSSGSWATDPVAMDLVSAFDMYIAEITVEIAVQSIDPAPTPSPDPSYYQSLVDWYEGVGRGNRYSVDQARTYAGFWEQVKHLYGDDANLEALPAPAPTPQLGAQVSEPC